MTKTLTILAGLGLFAIIALFASCKAKKSGGGDGFQDLTVAEFEAKMQEDNVVLLDVRTPGEIANGKIEGAEELDFRAAGFKDQLTGLDKDKTYLVYCASGGRSASACSMMEKMGFANVYNLVGGYGRWSAEH